VGTVGGFVVPAVVLVFEIASSHPLVHGGHPEHLLGRATALLVLGLIACLLGAFAFAAIGAERKTTPSLVAAVLYAGVGTAIGVVAIMAAFEALSTLYLHEAQDLFAAITLGAALAGVFLVALVLSDAWSATPAPQWLKMRSDCNRWARRSSFAAGLPVAAAGALYFLRARIAAEGAALHVIIVAGIVLSLTATLASMFRTVRDDDGKDRPLKQWEVVVAMALLTTYLVALILLMP
jgi:MFS family permease